MTVQGTQGTSPSVIASKLPETPKVEVKKYYQPYNGSRFILKDGTVLVFTNGCLTTADKTAIEEIEDAIKSGAEIFYTPVNVIQSDAQKMRAVGVSSHSGTGMQNTRTLAELAAESNGNK